MKHRGDERRVLTLPRPIDGWELRVRMPFMPEPLPDCEPLARNTTTMTAYTRPQSLRDALGLLSDRPHRILAGGTDAYPADAAAVG